MINEKQIKISELINYLKKANLDPSAIPTLTRAYQDGSLNLNQIEDIVRNAKSMKELSLVEILKNVMQESDDKLPLINDMASGKIKINECLKTLDYLIHHDNEQAHQHIEVSGTIIYLQQCINKLKEAKLLINKADDTLESYYRQQGII